MTWTHPHLGMLDYSPLDYSDMNAAMRGIATVGGALDYHNFSRSGIDDRESLEADVAFTWAVAAQEADLDFDHGGPLLSDYVALDVHVTALQGFWVPIADMTVTVRTKACMLWATFTGQHDNDDDGYDSGANASSTSYGAMYAIEVDGTIISESIIGSGELSNEVYDTSSGAGFTTPAVWGSQVAVLTECMVPVPAGVHVIRAMTYMPAASSSQKLNFVSNRELIVLNAEGANVGS